MSGIVVDVVDEVVVEVEVVVVVDDVVVVVVIASSATSPQPANAGITNNKIPMTK